MIHMIIICFLSAIWNPLSIIIFFGVEIHIEVSRIIPTFVKQL